MKKIIVTIIAAAAVMGSAYALDPVKFDKPDMQRGGQLMDAFSNRKSVREYSDRHISMKDLGDLLWAANGINREDGHTTNPTAMNRQDIKVYVVLPAGTYLYDNKAHALVPISEGDFRQKIRGNMPALNLLVVADDGEAGFSEVNAGYVAQNIYLFCAGNGMGTVSAGGMDRAAFTKACKLNGKQRIVIQHPVGYLK